MPPPYGMLKDPTRLHYHQTHGFSIVFHALSRSDRQLERLTVAQRSGDRTRGDLPGVVIHFRNLTIPTMAAIAAPLRRLKHLRLHLEDKGLQDAVPFDTSPSVIGRCGVAAFLRPLQCLQTLDLRMHAARTMDSKFFIVIAPWWDVFGDTTFSELRTLVLSGFWLESDDLRGVLDRHAKTLEEVTLVEINLGGTADAEYVLPGTYALPLSKDRPYTSSSALEYPEWEAVADTCKQLPKLRGLFIGKPSVRVHQQTLNVFDVEDLMSRGLDERPNCLDPTGVAGVLDQLFAAE